MNSLDILLPVVRIEDTVIVAARMKALKARIGLNSSVELDAEKHEFIATCPRTASVAAGFTEERAITALAEKVAAWFVENDANYELGSLRKWFFAMDDLGYEKEFCAHYLIKRTDEGASLFVCSLSVSIPLTNLAGATETALFSALKIYFGGEANRLGWSPQEKLFMTVTGLEI